MSINLFNNNAVSEFHFKTLESGNFLIQKCNHCFSFQYFPRTFCSTCNSESLHWSEVSGRGVVYSTTTVRRKVEVGGDFNVSLIDLEEGVRMMSTVVGVATEHVHIDMKVQLEIEFNDGIARVVFKPGFLYE